VCPLIQIPPISSSESAPTIVLKPKRSGWLCAWWAALHLLLLATVGLSGWPLLVKWLGIAAAAAHAIARYPASAPVIVAEGDGRWRVPEYGFDNLLPAAGTRFTGYWIVLRLRGASGRLNILLLADQLDRATWSRLLARLRRTRPPSSSRSGRGGRDTLRDLR
jgi:hypothetical protein